MAIVNTEFIKNISCSGKFNASACMSCGTCTALCPMEINTLPRLMFRHVMLGLESKVIENTENVFSCLLCKMCEESCPSNVHIAENIKCIRQYINQEIFKLGRS